MSALSRATLSYSSKETVAPEKCYIFMMSLDVKIKQHSYWAMHADRVLNLFPAPTQLYIEHNLPEDKCKENLLCLGKKYCYGSMEGEYCHCDYCKVGVRQLK